MGRTYVQIFFRTFAQLALAVALAAQGYAWTSGHDARVNFTTIGLGLMMAFIGAVIATLHAVATSPATTPLGKAIRSALQTVAAGLATVVINSVADLASVTTVLVSVAVAAVLAFAVTYLQNVPPAPAAVP